MRLRRTAASTTAALLLAASLAACTGDEEPDADDPTGSETSASSSEEPEPSEDTDQPEEPEETESSEIPTELTEPGERLAMDDVALVPLPYFPRGQGQYAVTLDSVEKKPIRLLDEAGVQRVEGLTDLYYVRQTYELVDPGSAKVQGTNLISHTQGLIDGVEQFDINADLPDCGFGAFFGDVEVGDRRPLCMAFVLPKGETLDEVVWYKYDTQYDGLLDGDYVYWSLEG